MDNAWYYFQSNGKCVVNAWANIKDAWYLFGTDGKMMTGWTDVDGDYYYLNTDGRMLIDWLTDSQGNKYYMDNTNGKMSKGWKQIGDALSLIHIWTLTPLVCSFRSISMHCSRSPQSSEEALRAPS